MIEYGDGCSISGPRGEESSGVNERVVRSTYGVAVSVGLVGCDKVCCDWGK